MSDGGEAGAVLSLLRGTTTPLPLTERLNREGDFIGSSTGNSVLLTGLTNASLAGAGTAISAGLDGFGNLFVVPIGRAYFIENMRITASASADFRLQYGIYPVGDGRGTPPKTDTWLHADAGQTILVPVNAFFRQGDTPVFNLFLKQLLTPAASASTFDASGNAVTSALRVTYGFTGFQIADDLNFGASKTILWLGDSRSNGTGPSSKATFIPWLTTKLYRDNGIDARLVLKAYSGSRTDGHEVYRASGRYDIGVSPALIVYDVGTNDANVLTTASSMANIAALVAWKQKLYPKAKLLILGSPPRQDTGETSSTTGLAPLRAAEAAYVSGLADDNVLFYDQGGSYDRTVFANYVSTDTNGAAVHPGDTGITQIWNGGYNGKIGLKAWLLGNMPKI